MQPAKYRVEYPNGSTYEVDVSEVMRLDARKVEIPSANKATGPELMRSMELGHGIAGALLATVGLEYDRIQEAIARRAAEVTLDLVPQILKEKGLATEKNISGTVDQRNHILTLDKTYGALKDVLAQLDAIKALLRIHVQGFVMAFSAVKRTMDSQVLSGNGLPPGATDSNAFINRGTYDKPSGGNLDAKTSEDIGLPIGNARW